MVSRRATPQKSRPSRPEFVHQFLIVLSRTDPLVWRRIQVPLTYSFWDLHVAIQDAMGWLDYHLHEFRVLDGRDKIRAIGIPTGEEPPGERPPVPGWRVQLFQPPPIPPSACVVCLRLWRRLGARARVRRRAADRAIDDIQQQS